MDTEMNDAGSRVPVRLFQALDPVIDARGDLQHIRIRREGNDWALLVAMPDGPAIRVQEPELYGDGKEITFVHPQEILAVFRDGPRVHPTAGLSEQAWESFLERAGLDATRQEYLSREESWEPFP